MVDVFICDLSQQLSFVESFPDSVSSVARLKPKFDTMRQIVRFRLAPSNVLAHRQAPAPVVRDVQVHTHIHQRTNRTSNFETAALH